MAFLFQENLLQILYWDFIPNFWKYIFKNVLFLPEKKAFSYENMDTLENENTANLG